jgi:hypothetical protein
MVVCSIKCIYQSLENVVIPAMTCRYQVLDFSVIT